MRNLVRFADNRSNGIQEGWNDGFNIEESIGIFSPPFFLLFNPIFHYSTFPDRVFTAIL